MLSITPVDTFDCVVFGATGNLTLHKLLPALYCRYCDGQMPPDYRVIGIARSRLSDDDFCGRAAEALDMYDAPGDRDPADRTRRTHLARGHGVAATHHRR